MVAVDTIGRCAVESLELLELRFRNVAKRRRQAGMIEDRCKTVGTQEAA